RLLGALADQPKEFAASRFATKVIDGSISSGRRDPATRVRGEALDGPLPEGEGECLLDRVLGEVDVTEDAYQGGHRPTGLLAEDAPDQRVVDDGQGSAAGRVHEGPDLDRRRDRARDLRRPAERGGMVGGLDDVDAAQVLLRL